MPRFSHLKGRFRRSRGWRRRVVILLFLLVAALLAAGFHLTRPRRLASFASQLLTDMTGADVRIDSARLDLDGTIRLRAVSLSLPRDPSDTQPARTGEADRVFTADQVLIRHDLASLLRGKFLARSLTLVSPTLYVTEGADGVYNLQRLQAVRQQAKPGALPRLPELFLRDGAVRFGELDPQPAYTALGEIRLSGNLIELQEKPGVYLFNLRQQMHDGSPGPALSGNLDLLRLALDAKIERFALLDDHRNILPRERRKWWDTFKPAGAAPSIAFGFDPETGLHAHINIQDGSLLLPFGDKAVAMSKVHGRFILSRDAVEIQNLTGAIEDLNYQLDGVVNGFSRDAPFCITANIAPFRIPAEPRYLLALPADVQRQFQRFAPSGEFRATVIVERKEPDGPLTYKGNVRVSEGRFTYFKFPYAVEDLHGDLTFNNDEIIIVGLNAKGPTGASATVTGRIAPLNDTAGFDLEIVGVNTPVDNALRMALQEKDRRILDEFVDVEAYGKMIEQGLLSTAGKSTLPPAATQPTTQPTRTPPVFELGGRISFMVNIKKPVGTDTKLSRHIEVDMAGGGAVLRDWHYPLRVIKGKLVIEPPHIYLRDVDFEGPTGLRGVIRGVIGPGPDGKDYPDLSVTAINIPIDALLLNSLPPHEARRLRESGLAGTIETAGTIHRAEKGGVDFKLDARLRKATARPFGKRFAVSDIDADVVISKSRVDFTKLEGRHGEGRLSLVAAFQRNAGESRTDFTLKATGLKLDDTFADLLPADDPATARAAALLEQYKPAGVIDLIFEFLSIDRDKPARRVELRPKSLAFDFAGKRLELTEMQGVIKADADKITLDDIRASFDGGKIRGGGDVIPGPPARAAFKFAAENIRLGGAIRQVLPAGAVATLDAIKLDGTVQLTDTTLTYNAEDGAIGFAGDVQLTQGAADLGVPITDISGKANIKVGTRTGEPHPKLDLKLNLDRLDAAGRRVAPLSLAIVPASGDPSKLELRDLRGTVYGGTLVGTGVVDLATPTRYSVSLTLNDTALDPMIHPDKPASPPATDAPARRPAKLSANLAVEGEAARAATRRGRGAFEIRDAALYDLPVALAMLQIANLTLPSARSFDRAAAEFIIDSNKVHFDTIRLEAPNIEMAGKGSMKYATRELDLEFTSRNPNAVKLGPVTDLLKGVHDEIITIHVGGTLDEPQTELRSLSGIKKTMNDIFGAEKPAPKIISPPTEPLQPAPASQPATGAAPASTSGQ